MDIEKLVLPSKVMKGLALSVTGVNDLSMNIDDEVA